jgi:hypothetical protein
MAWIRLSDDYNDHPKFDHLSDGAFRLWHQAIGFCRKFKTDGMIPTQTVRGFKAYSPKRMRELMMPWREHEHPLWHAIDGFGVKVHDYLEWNPSKDEENERRAESRSQMRALRERRKTAGVPPVSTNTPPTSMLTARDVKGREREGTDSKENVSTEKPSSDERARRLREELYPAWYARYRHGARLRISLIANSLEWKEALSLVETWDDARLEKLARIVLTTNDEYIAGTDRGFRIFAMKASWADSRLSEIESRSA